MLKNILIACGGIASGALVTWRYLKRKYERLNDVDTESIRKMYKEKIKSLKETINKYENEESSEEVEVESITTDEKGENILEKYWKPMKEKNEEQIVFKEVTKETEFSPADEPYVISPNEFNNPEFDHYNIRTLYWYADDILTDEENGIISDYASFLGTDWVNHFGEFGEDCVYVRNERNKIQYEILERIDNYFK